MINTAVIIEDEAIAATNLTRTLLEVSPTTEVVAVLQTIEESVEHFATCRAKGQYPDIVFMDIHLADGSAFRIFEQVEVECPVVFTTAYDQYALEAFRAGGFDYLLKPVNPADLRRTLDRLGRYTSHDAQPTDYSALIDALAQRRTYRSVFLLPVADRLEPLEVNRVACFELDDKIVRALLTDGTHRAIDYTLDYLVSQLDPSLFFRANRQYIVSRQAIAEIRVWPIGKLRLGLSVPTANAIIVSKARTPEFKQWYTK